MEVYIVTCIVEEEYLGREIIGVFANYGDAISCRDSQQYTVHHWSGRDYDAYDIEVWNVEE